MSSSAPLVFTCEECGAKFELDDAMRQTLLEVGCLMCGTGVSEHNFSPASPQ
jgi:transcription initiation factor IIE alpha subunit